MTAEFFLAVVHSIWKSTWHMLSLNIFAEWLTRHSLERLQTVSVYHPGAGEEATLWVQAHSSKTVEHQMPDWQLEQNCACYNVMDLPHWFYFLTLLQGRNTMFGLLLHLLPPRNVFLWQLCSGQCFQPVLRVGLPYLCCSAWLVTGRRVLHTGSLGIGLQGDVCAHSYTRKSKVLLFHKNTANCSSLSV